MGCIYLFVVEIVAYMCLGGNYLNLKLLHTLFCQFLPMVHQWPEVSSKSARDEGCVDGWEERTAPLSLGPFPACKPKLQQAGAYYLVLRCDFKIDITALSSC